MNWGTSRGEPGLTPMPGRELWATFLVVSLIAGGAGATLTLSLGSRAEPSGTAGLPSFDRSPSNSVPTRSTDGSALPLVASAPRVVSPASAPIVLQTLDLYNNSVVGGNYIPSLYSNGYGPVAVAVDSGRGQVFVANEEGSNVSVISDSTDKVVATVSVGNEPESLAFDSGL
ncbi:MAG: hypothetical protein L3K03_08840, partial [Thermoplasmata archaeon]|nr:hypothetical protein [Thermoplasmata archaeon]